MTVCWLRKTGLMPRSRRIMNTPYTAPCLTIQTTTEIQEDCFIKKKKIAEWMWVLEHSVNFIPNRPVSLPGESLPICSIRLVQISLVFPPLKQFPPVIGPMRVYCRGIGHLSSCVTTVYSLKMADRIALVSFDDSDTVLWIVKNM